MSDLGWKLSALQTYLDEDGEKEAAALVGEAIAAIAGIPAETLRGLRDGSLVAVPREPTEAWWNSVAVRLDAHTSSLFMDRLRDAHAQLMLAAAQGQQK